MIGWQSQPGRSGRSGRSRVLCRKTSKNSRLPRMEQKSTAEARESEVRTNEHREAVRYDHQESVCCRLGRRWSFERPVTKNLAGSSVSPALPLEP